MGFSGHQSFGYLTLLFSMILLSVNNKDAFCVSIKKGAYPENPSNQNKSLWERLFDDDGYLYPNVAKVGGLQSQGVWGWSRSSLLRTLSNAESEVLRLSALFQGETTWQNRPHPSNSPVEVSKNLSFYYDIGNNCGPLSNLCHVVYATKGCTLWIA